MNSSLASHLHDFTAPLVLGPVSPTQSTDTGSPAASLWQPGKVIGYRYRIVGLLDTGGTATVYEAVQLDLVRRVAIKVLTAECAAESPCAERFEREALTLAELQHPCIVSVFEFGRSEEGIAFMAMELVEGPALRAHLAAEGALPWRVAAGLAAQLADALEVAHAAGVVHGDVSARNVLLTRRGDTLVCKLIDFGAARRIGAMAFPASGTIRYVAPELFKGEAPHIRSDLFALGALLKEMVGEAKFAAVPQVLQRLVESMLDANPLGRPGSAAEVARRLRLLLDSQPATVSCDIEIPMHADPHDAPRRSGRADPPAARLRVRLMLAGLVGGAALVALVWNLQGRTSASWPFQVSVAAAPQSARTRTGPSALKESRVVPTTLQREPEAVPIGPQPMLDPPKVAEPHREAIPAPEPVTEPADVPTSQELQRDESVERREILASLDRWLSAYQQDLDGESAPMTATRLGDPGIVFDPSATSASVTYRKRLLDSDINGDGQWIVEEQVFFAKLDGAWQIVNPVL